MKKNFLKIIAAVFLFAACSEDDPIVGVPDDPTPGGDNPTATGTVVLNEVEYLGNRVEIYNNSNASVDLSSYWLCLGPGQYSEIGGLVTEGNVNLGAGEYLSVSYEMPEAAGGLGLYSSNNFTDSSAIVDFVQWGAAGAARENVAVAASLWTAGEFVPVMGSADNSIVYDGNGNGASNWAETSTVTIGADNVLTVPAEVRSIVINEVQFGNRNLIELYNNGNVAADISSYWLCLGPGQYVQLSAATIESGDTNLDAGEFVVVNYDLPDDQGGLGLYSNNSFTDSNAIMDFVQWGAAGAARENVAVEAGIWTVGEFVATVNATSSIEYDGEGDAASDWAEETKPSFGVANDIETASTTFNITITNAAEVFNVHTFSERNRTGEAATTGPLNQDNDYYEITFQAVPGTKITPVTMMGNSNDWFLAPEDLTGISLWENGSALNNVDIADQLVLYDLGTEIDNEPTYFPPAGANVGPADPNNLVRLVDRGGMRGNDYLTAILTYAAGDGQSAGTFTLRITAINTANFVVTPGMAVLHANNEPLFTVGEPDRGYGLEGIAEDGMPGALYNFYKETGSGGSFLRLASTRTVFSPGLVYAFNSASDPLVLQGQTNPTGNGLEELAEDGVNSVAVDYLNGLGYPVAASNEAAPVGPGQSLTFSIEVPQDQGYRFGFATMFVDTNDWFLAYNNAGYPLFDENGVPASGYGASEKSYLYDAGTEVDEAVGFGMYQAPRQSGLNEGPSDANTAVRRVSDLEDVQFGKGVYDNGPGVVYLHDPRGGYNVIKIEIQPQ